MSRRDFYEEEKLKRIVYIFGIVLILAIVTFLTIFVMYNKKLKEESSKNLLSLGSMNDIVSNDELAETSFSADKDIASSTNIINTIKKINQNTVKSNSKTKNIINTSEIVEATVTNKIAENTIVNDEIIEEVELKFIPPVSGEIIKDYALDTLIYSNTLEEWTTHPGIDIKADKTTVVMASEAGIIESIKNDPRYGLTITIAHDNGFKTIYSNLLTTEFVSENENIEKGQTIGTIGDTSSFEIADETHLHFEMYKDGELVNPTIYLK